MACFWTVSRPSKSIVVVNVCRCKCFSYSRMSGIVVGGCQVDWWSCISIEHQRKCQKNHPDIVNKVLESDWGDMVQTTSQARGLLTGGQLCSTTLTVLWVRYSPTYKSNVLLCQNGSSISSSSISLLQTGSKTPSVGLWVSWTMGRKYPLLIPLRKTIPWAMLNSDLMFAWKRHNPMYIVFHCWKKI